MKQCPFLLRLCQEVLLRVFRWFFFFAVPFAGSGKWMQSVSACPMNETGSHTQRAIREEWLLSPGWTSPVGSENNHTSFVVVCPFHASGDVFFLLVILFFTDFPLKFFSTQSASVFVYLHFCAFQWAASGSHFRSGRKGNSGIGRESKVKPPVFGKNLQPCG